MNLPSGTAEPEVFLLFSQSVFGLWIYICLLMSGFVSVATTAVRFLIPTITFWACIFFNLNVGKFSIQTAEHHWEVPPFFFKSTLPVRHWSKEHVLTCGFSNRKETRSNQWFGFVWTNTPKLSGEIIIFSINSAKFGAYYPSRQQTEITVFHQLN